jgi:hypothetical protein
MLSSPGFLQLKIRLGVNSNYKQTFDKKATVAIQWEKNAFLKGTGT